LCGGNEDLKAELERTKVELQRCQLVLSFAAEREKERERRQKELLTENVTLKIEATKVRVDLEKTKQLLQESVKAHHAAVQQYLEEVSAHMLMNAGNKHSDCAVCTYCPPSPQVSVPSQQCVYRVPEQLDETIAWSAESCPQTPSLTEVPVGGGRPSGGDRDGCTPDRMPSVGQHADPRLVATNCGTPDWLPRASERACSDVWVGGSGAPKGVPSSMREPGQRVATNGCGTPNVLPGSVHEFNQMGVGSVVQTGTDQRWWYRGEVSDPAMRRLRPPAGDDGCPLVCPNLGGNRRPVSPSHP